uniref:Uncharacterized protein n=1 Tax=Clandestinovirus TaxID=2831644 RepID=A0A8F8KR76_9VIRU|nr:hypothetical protein KOM_12_411 [Clandestinovirus]
MNKTYSVLLSMLTCWYIVCIYLDISYDEYPLFDGALMYGLDANYHTRIGSQYCNGIQACSYSACNLYQNSTVGHIVIDPLLPSASDCDHYNILAIINNRKHGGILTYMTLMAIVACFFKLLMVIASIFKAEVSVNAMNIAEKFVFIITMFFFTIITPVRKLQITIHTILLIVTSFYDLLADTLFRCRQRNEQESHNHLYDDI